ncbi:uncharacterized protein [Henckelia pumila]|uniref:uncharacterized protein isoform X2 n=1 Tax=Henckelia pumila TaxID=405737 RepID=UPI003C6DC736
MPMLLKFRPVFGCHFGEEWHFKFSMVMYKLARKSRHCQIGFSSWCRYFHIKWTWASCASMQEHMSECMHLCKHDNSWKKGSTYHVAISYIQCFFVWFGAMLIFGALDLVVPPTEAGKIVKHFLHFVSSMSTALTFHLSASSLYLQTQKYMEIDGALLLDTRRMFGQWVVNVVYYCMRAVGTRAIMELYGCRPCFKNDLSNLAFLTCVGDWIWRLCIAYASKVNYAARLKSTSEELDEAHARLKFDN